MVEYLIENWIDIVQLLIGAFGLYFVWRQLVKINLQLKSEKQKKIEEMSKYINTKGPKFRSFYVGDNIKFNTPFQLAAYLDRPEPKYLKFEILEKQGLENHNPIPISEGSRYYVNLIINKKAINSDYLLLLRYFDELGNEYMDKLRLKFEETHKIYCTVKHEGRNTRINLDPLEDITILGDKPEYKLRMPDHG